ncbi:MAG: hypothetical protein K2O45_15080 [Oscillospiraceae bacterium]|nr:hypothetical protein [Oscillospiraceae bacterium]
MSINGIPGAYNSYGSYRATSRTVNRSASKISVSEDGLFEPISKKVSGALSDEYIEQIKAQARADAAKGRYMDGYDSKQRTGFSAMRDAQMKQFVSPDRGRPISQVSTMLKNPNLVLRPGENLFDLLSIPFTAKVFNGPMFGTTAEIYDGNGEMIAGYRDSCSWFDVPTKDETRFQYESNQIYCEAYKAAEAEIAATKQIAAPAVSGEASASFDVKA